MRKRRSIHERREEIKAQIEKLQAKEKELAVRDKAQERKARTKRLIEIGAVVESVYGEPLKKDRLVYLKRFLETMKWKGLFPLAVKEGEKLWELLEKEKNKTESGDATEQNVETDAGTDVIEEDVEQNQNFKVDGENNLNL